MERAVKDEGGITWTLVRAFSGVAGSAGGEAAGRASGKSADEAGTVPVVCTPSREERTLRLQLPEDWAERLSDEELLHALAQARLGA
jgi:hypothetical protein